ncbi:outer membrane lipoprotein carrier protein LolA [uncultured Sphingomonas sp.]|uniref:LolA family protein n=1 Tax=uncultured Sphingomonas sp. TaxID=158754 RepID=UPI0025CD8DEB|nr:outer membrane lipoprotein carrier protein LolA [uncultured Sphingomonas sp.]
MLRYTAPLVLLAAAPVSAATGVLGQVQTHLRAVETMTADFTQTDQRGKTLTGTLTLKRPGRVRFQYQKGVPLLVVGDGKALIMIDYQVAQVSRWPIGNSPLSILLDPNRDLSGIAKVLPNAPAGRILIEGRDPKHPEIGTITIGFTQAPTAPGGLMLAGWTVLDAQGNRSTLVLSNQRFNVPVSDRTFLWRDPRPRNRNR